MVQSNQTDNDSQSLFPSFQVPLRDVEQNGKTITKLEILQELSTGFIVTPLVAFLETIAVAKTLARKGNYKVDVTQELFALGIVNVVGSFFWSFPVAGSFSRSALNSQIGVKTPIGGESVERITLYSTARFTQ